MHARFRTEKAVRVLALDLEDGALDARFLAFAQVEDVDTESLPLCPARVHAHEHLCPVLRLGATGPRRDLDLRVAMVSLAAQQGAQLELAQLGVDLLRLSLDLALHIVVGLGGKHLLELERASHAGREPFVRLDPSLELLDLLDHLTRLLLIVPEAGIGHARFERAQRFAFALEIKDTPSARRGAPRAGAACELDPTQPSPLHVRVCDEPSAPLRRTTARVDRNIRAPARCYQR